MAAKKRKPRSKKKAAKKARPANPMVERLRERLAAEKQYSAEIKKSNAEYERELKAQHRAVLKAVLQELKELKAGHRAELGTLKAEVRKAHASRRRLVRQASRLASMQDGIIAALQNGDSDKNQKSE